MKKKILLVVFSLISMFIGLGFVKAENITTYIECSYEPKYGTIKGSGPINVMFTELLDENGKRFQLFAKKNPGDAITQLGDITGYFGFNVDDSADSNSTFETAMKKNNGKCPNYMAMEYMSSDFFQNKINKAIFYNDINNSSVCSGEPGSGCQAYFKNTSTINNVKINPDEDSWFYKTSIDNDEICSDLSITIDIKNKQLYGLPIYGRNTKYVQGVNWTQAKTIYGVWFDQISSLSLNNSISGIMFDPQTENDFSSTTSLTFQNLEQYKYYSGETACFIGLNGSVSFTKTKSCSSKTDLSSTFNGYENEINSIYPNINSIYEELSSPSYVDSTGFHQRTAYTYANESKLATLKGVSEKASSVSNENSNRLEAIIKELETIIDGTHPALNGKKPCQDTISEANVLLTRIKNTYSDYKKRLEVIEEAATNARNRSQELGATPEELNSMDNVLKQLNVKIEKYKLITENIKTTVLDNANINLGGLSSSGCGVISAELKKFLNTVLWYIRIAGVVLTIILSLLDYIKAATGSDDKSMAAANKKFLTRVILVAILFLIPALLDFLLSTLNISTTAGSISCLD